MKFFILQIAGATGIDPDILIDTEGFLPLLKRWYEADDLDAAVAWCNENI